MATLVYANLTIPPAAALNATAQPRPVAAAALRALVPLVYGIDRLSALIMNVLPSASDSSQVLVQCLWAHACTGVYVPLLNDQVLPAGSSATHYTGSQVTPDAALVAAFAAQGITYSAPLTGFAYSVFSVPLSAVPAQLGFSASIWGRKLYDPRKDSTAGGSGAHRLADPTTWEFSDNPSLALADWLSNALYGAGEPVDWSSVPAAANANDTLVGSPAEKRRVIGWAITRAASIPALMETLRAYAGCWLVATGAGTRLLPDADVAPVASYSHDSGQIASIEPLAKSDLGNAPTVVEVVYTDTSQVPWREAAATATVPGAGSTLPLRVSEVALTGIQRYSQAYREAVERLNKLRLNDLATTVEVFDEGIAAERGDIITLTHPMGVTAKPMRVLDVEMPGPGRWRLQLAEHDPAVYSTLVALAPTYTDAGLEIGPGKPAAAAGGNQLRNPCFLDKVVAPWAITANAGLTGAVVSTADSWAGAYNLDARETGYILRPGAGGTDTQYVDVSPAPGGFVASPQRWYQFSVWVCQLFSGAQIYCEFRNAAGTVIGYGGNTAAAYSSMSAGGPDTAWRAQPSADGQAQYESSYTKLWFTAQAPAGTARIVPVVRMYQAPAAPYSYAFLTRAMLCEVSPGCDVLVPWDFGAGGMYGLPLVGTLQLAVGAAAEVYRDDYDFGGGSYGTVTARSFSITPPVDCTIEVSATIEATNVVGDSGKQVGWWVTPAGGSTVIAAGFRNNVATRTQLNSADSFSATGGVALTFDLKTNNGGSAPNLLLYRSTIRLSIVKR
ncbi:MAG: hypothetical protein J0M00_24305 [Burkholderiales bacterium]|nr:hypothetical protein [Burkholderiales bacterium]